MEALRRDAGYARSSREEAATTCSTVAGTDSQGKGVCLCPSYLSMLTTTGKQSVLATGDPEAIINIPQLKQTLECGLCAIYYIKVLRKNQTDLRHARPMIRMGSRRIPTSGEIPSHQRLGSRRRRV